MCLSRSLTQQRSVGYNRLHLFDKIHDCSPSSDPRSLHSYLVLARIFTVLLSFHWFKVILSSSADEVVQQRRELTVSIPSPKRCGRTNSCWQPDFQGKYKMTRKTLSIGGRQEPLQDLVSIALAMLP